MRRLARRLVTLALSATVAGYAFYAIKVSFHLITNPTLTFTDALPEDRSALVLAPVIVPATLLVVTAFIFLPVEKPSPLWLLGSWMSYLVPFLAVYVSCSY